MTGAPDGGAFMAKVGMVSLPAQATLGQEGGRYFSGRVDAGYAATGKCEESFFGGGSLMLNDPELMALYPYAVNSLTVRVFFDGSF